MTKRERWLGASGLALMVVGLRLATVLLVGTDVPLWDQWDIEVPAFVSPLGAGHFEWSRLLLPINEHRIVFTLALNAALDAVSHQWDGRQQAVVNCFLYAGFLAFAWALLASELPRPWQLVLFVMALVAGGLPLDYENLFSGFQSQFYFVAFFSLACLHQLLRAPALSWRWHVGWLSGACALISLGSGLVAPCVVAIFSGAAIVMGRSWREHLPSLIAGAALAAIGLAIRAPTPAQNLAFHARSAGQFLGYLLAGLAWPLESWRWPAAVFVLPSAILLIQWVRARGRGTTYVSFVLAGATWVALQSAAIAWSRANIGLPQPANRYSDLYLYGGLFSLAAARQVVASVTWVPRRLGLALGASVAALFAIGIAAHASHTFGTVLPQRDTEFRSYESSLRAYVVSHDPAALTPDACPYPRPARIVEVLSEPSVVAQLPPSVGGRLSWLSRVALIVAGVWPCWLLMGLMTTWLVARPASLGRRGWVVGMAFAVGLGSIAKLVHDHANRILFSDQWIFLNPILSGNAWTMFSWQHGPHRQGVGDLIIWAAVTWSRWSATGIAWATFAVMATGAAVALRLKRELAGPLSLADCAIPFLFLRLGYYEELVTVPNPAHGAAPILLLVVSALLALRLEGEKRDLALSVMIFLSVNTGFALFGAAVMALMMCGEFLIGSSGRAALQFSTKVVLPLSALSTFFIHYRYGDYASECVARGVPGALLLVQFVGAMLGHYFEASGQALLWLGLPIVLAVTSFGVLLLRDWFVLARPRRHTAILLAGVASTLGFAIATAHGRYCLGPEAPTASRYQPLLIPAFLALFVALREGLLRNLFAAVIVCTAFYLPANDWATLRGFDDAKRRWERCYRLEHSVERCDRETSFAVYPVPANVRLQERMDYFEKNKLGIFAP